MHPELIVTAVLALVVLLVLVRSVRIVPQARAAVVERLGRFNRTLTPGLAVVVPFVDKVRPLIDLREQVVSFPPQPVITADNLMVSIDTVIYFQVTDPKSATYEIASYIQGVEQLTVTTLRDVVGRMDLERTLTSREEINNALRGVLDEATGRWGIRVNRVELKAIEPPASIQDSMEKQMRAERDKRAAILTAEGQRQSQILAAEGAKESSVLRAEGERQAQILTAQADQQARVLRAKGEAEAIQTVFAAIHEGRPDPALLSYQYLQVLPQIARGEANKMWIIPAELTRALEGLSGLGGQAAGALASMTGGSGADTSTSTGGATGSGDAGAARAVGGAPNGAAALGPDTRPALPAPPAPAAPAPPAAPSPPAVSAAARRPDAPAGPDVAAGPDVDPGPDAPPGSGGPAASAISEEPGEPAGPGTLTARLQLGAATEAGPGLAAAVDERSLPLPRPLTGDLDPSGAGVPGV